VFVLRLAAWAIILSKVVTYGLPVPVIFRSALIGHIAIRGWPKRLTSGASLDAERKKCSSFRRWFLPVTVPLTSKRDFVPPEGTAVPVSEA
jgi:hypothetical protein